MFWVSSNNVDNSYNLYYMYNLFHVMHYYSNIIIIIYLILIITWEWVWQSADWIDGEPIKCMWGHTPRVSCMRRVPVYESPRWVNDMDLEFMGSAQGVPIELGCLR